ncbi:MAG: hypothetical protein Q9163_003707 [Psora crenata]
MTSLLKIFIHNVATLVDLTKGVYNEDQWYKRYRQHLWTERDDRFIMRLLAITYHGRTQNGKRLEFETVDQVLKAMVKEEGAPPCIKYAKKGGFSSSEVFGAKRIYRASRKAGDCNHGLYRSIKGDTRDEWNAEAERLLQNSLDAADGRMWVGTEDIRKYSRRATGQGHVHNDDDKDSIVNKEKREKRGSHNGADRGVFNLDSDSEGENDGQGNR